MTDKDQASMCWPINRLDVNKYFFNINKFR